MDETSQATERVDKTDPVTARKRKAKQNAKAKRVKITGAVSTGLKQFELPTRLAKKKTFVQQALTQRAYDYTVGVIERIESETEIKGFKEVSSAAIIDVFTRPVMLFLRTHLNGYLRLNINRKKDCQILH